jgi:hypothetical protein
MDRTWIDKDLYARYGLDDDEVAYIESQIKAAPAPAAGESDD